MGDDAAAIKISATRQTLITTDLLVEGIDFDLRWSTYQQVGYKAMAANLSDIAAMGGTPCYALVSIALPTQTQTSSVDMLYKGLMGLGRRYNVHLVGGDTSASLRDVMISVVLMGQIEPRHLIRRSGAKPGDLIFVTGPLGDSCGGLEILKSKRRKGRNLLDSRLIRRHFFPVPRVKEGQLLATKGLATAMIDLSDGLSTDLHHLLRASGVGARLHLHQIPVSKALRSFATRKHSSPYRYALEGGEDLELLFTVSPMKVKEIRRLVSLGRLKASLIGEITRKQQGVTIVDNFHEKPLKETGYEHFRKTREQK